MMHYSDETRADNPTALPNVETFYLADNECCNDETGEPMPYGWYYWYCLPGCMPDSDPYGPYTTEAEALDASREE